MKSDMGYNKYNHHLYLVFAKEQSSRQLLVSKLISPKRCPSVHRPALDLPESLVDSSVLGLDLAGFLLQPVLNLLYHS